MLYHGAPKMGIAEGVETAISAHVKFAMPVWACLSAPSVAGFPVIHSLNHLTIFADHDDAGISAARKCASRYLAAGIKGEIHHPTPVGWDWNDHLMRSHYEP